MKFFIADSFQDSLTKLPGDMQKATKTTAYDIQQDPANPPTIHRAKGCEHCNHLGYRGRIGIYEVVEVNEEISSLIHKRAGELDLEHEARLHGPSIHADGVQKILDGVTTVEEVLRVTHRSR